MTMSIEEAPPGAVEAPGCKASELAEIGAIVACAHEAARLLKLLANEKRLVILCFLATRGEMPVGALVEALGLSQSALSQHLAKLRRDGLVLFRREAQTLHYRLADPRVMRMLGVLEEIFCKRPPTVDLMLETTGCEIMTPRSDA
jgi:DNA-binding transcriptional ArsR family regulator